MDDGRAHALPRWFRVNLWLHRWTGLIATPFFLILCVTGSILIFHEPVDRLLGDVPPAAAMPAHPLTAGQLAAAAAKQSPGEDVQSVSLSPDMPGQAYVGMTKPGPSKLEDGRLILLDRGTGKLLPLTPPASTFTGILLELHSRWFAGLAGELFGAALALTVLVALISGLVVHAPFTKRLAFGRIRRERGARTRQLDLHNFIGTVVTGWALVVASTGLALDLGTLALMRWQATDLKEMVGTSSGSQPSRLADPDRVIATARRAMPDRDPQLIIWPNTDFSSPRHFTVLMYGTKPWNERLFDIAVVDAENATLSSARPLPMYLQAVVASGPLHFGDYGGLPLKLLWLASAWLTLFITANGAWLWFAKRRSARRTKHTAIPVGLA